MRKLLFGAVAGLALLAGCNAADVASQNISTAADNFEINRHIVFYDTWTDTVMLTMDGRCSIGNHDSAGMVSVTCKVGPNQYKKNYLGLSNNVTWLVQQVDPAPGDPWHYRVILRPSEIVPNIQVNSAVGGN